MSQTTDRADLYSPGIEEDLFGMDRAEFLNNIENLAQFHGQEKEKLLDWCLTNSMGILLLNDELQNITDDQIKAMKDIMTLFLLQSDGMSSKVRFICIEMLLYVSLVLLSSNKKHDWEAWIREHLSELKSFRTATDETFLHLAAISYYVSFPRAPFVKLLVEDGKMDVNVENQFRQTPLHWIAFSEAEFLFDKKTTPVEDYTRIAELLIYNGAHMDSVDVNGHEASFILFPRIFPQFSFNVNLQCLAAKAILKHEISYQKSMPTKMISLIESHKPGQL